MGPGPGKRRRRAPETAPGFRRGLERIADRVLGRKFDSPQGFWDVETELLDLQQDIQAAIARPSRGRATPESRERIQELRYALWHARRFGDALAWLLFRNNRRRLHALSENSRVPVPERGHSTVAVMISAAELANRGHGLPLLHDLTDLLRVGDVTFFKGDDPPHTMEIKAQVVESTKVGDTVTSTYKIHAVWPHQGPAPAGAPVTNRPAQAALTSPRFMRQLERMTKAHLISTAIAGKPTDIGGVKTILIESDGEAPPSNWAGIKRLVRTARRDGYASAVVSDGILLVGIYVKDSKLDTDDERLDRAAKDMADSGLFFPEPERNAMGMWYLPDPREEGPSLHLPYFLYPLPRSAIFDLLHGRLFLLAVVNLGRIAETLREAGLRAELRNGALHIFTELELDGARYLAELPDFRPYINEMVREGHQLTYLVEIASAMAKGIADQVPMIREAAREGT